MPNKGISVHCRVAAPLGIERAPAVFPNNYCNPNTRLRRRGPRSALVRARRNKSDKRSGGAPADDVAGDSGINT